MFPLMPMLISFAMRRYRTGWRINVVQVSFLLGHEQLETTMRYLDITTEDKIKVLATLEDEAQKTIPKKWKNKKTLILLKHIIIIYMLHYILYLTM